MSKEIHLQFEIDSLRSQLVKSEKKLKSTEAQFNKQWNELANIKMKILTRWKETEQRAEAAEANCTALRKTLVDIKGKSNGEISEPGKSIYILTRAALAEKGEE